MLMKKIILFAYVYFSFFLLPSICESGLLKQSSRYFKEFEDPDFVQPLVVSIILVGLLLILLVLLRQTTRAKPAPEIEPLSKQREFVMDNLTQLYNKRFFDEYYDKEVSKAKRYKVELSLLVCSVDDFSRIAETQGKNTVNAVISEIAKIIKKTSRSSDLPVRRADDEFIILLPETNLAGARKLATKLQSQVGDISVRGINGVTLNIGMSSYKQDGDSMFIKANQALYTAKRSTTMKEVSSDTL